MRRIALGLTVVALTLTACQDAQQPAASFQVSDGSAFGGNGNPHFYFLPPLVPSPTYTGMFAPDLLPYLRVEVSGPYASELAATCGTPTWTFDASNGLVANETAGRFEYGWNTNADSMETGKVYRLCVVLAPPGADPFVLGFRDISPSQGGGSVSEAPVYLFNNGSNLPLKFRVEDGVLNAALCEYYETIGNDYDCTAQILGSNETATCDNATCELTTGIVNEPELFLIEKFALENPLCFEEVDGFPLGIDIPQYAGCVRITVFDADQSFDGFQDGSYGTVGACFYAESGPPLKMLNTPPGSGIDQDESMQMHVQYPETIASNLDPNETMPTVWALPWGNVTADVFASCDEIFDEEPQQEVAWLMPAKRLWNYAKGLVAPKRAFAFHTGFGGHTTLKSTEPSLSDEGTLSPASALRVEGEPGGVAAYTGAAQHQTGEKVYRLAWALPSAMEPASFSSGSQAADVSQPSLPTLYVDQGDQVDVAVLVQDNGALYGQGRYLGDPRAVEGANVHFLVDDVEQESVFTGFEGLASFSWTAAGSGLRTISAQGFGIGTDGGPFDAFDGTTYVNQATRLAYGKLDFPVYVCDASLTPNLVDGVVASGEYPSSNKVDFTAKVSGGAAAATLYWAYDCSNLYFALEVAADDELANEIVLVFDNTNNGATVGDDQWSLLRNSKTGQFVIADKYLTSKCVGSKQATCGALDTSDGGTDDLSGGKISYDSGKGVTVYEIAHPLTGDAAHDIQIDLVNGTTIGVYVVLQMGTGAQGNTQFPGFRNYLPIQIGPLQ